MGYEFKNDMLLLHAITHSSLKNDSPEIITYDNEKLEFIGDSVLDLIVSNFLLWEKGYSENEGLLTANRARLVNESALASLARKISLNEILILGKSARMTKVQNHPSVLADGFEALIGAIFLDSSYDVVEEVVLSSFKADFLRELSDQAKDYKTLINEITNKNKLSNPVYEIIASSGPDHARTFTSQIIIDGKALAKGRGSSKKESEQRAAELAYKILAGGDHGEN